MKLPYAEPFKIKTIEHIQQGTPEERMQWLKKARFNLFNLKSKQVYIDLLTDSGTGAMSDQQWGAIMTGDESYAGASSYDHLKDAIQDITGFEHFLPNHQGRAAENVIFSTLLKKDDIVPGNAHFDTTKGHIEFRNAHAVDCTVDEAFDTTLDFPFKGNVDLEKLEKIFLSNPADKIPVVVVTITCNTAGGQPVSMQNISDVSAMVKKYGSLLIFDGARFAENAYFIKTREEGYAQKPMKDIIREMFSYGDGMTMSSKKDGLVNIGGFTGLRDEELFRRASVFNIMFEGYLTYGGMAGRDINALATGLYEGIDERFLESRTKQVAYLGNLLKEYGIPVQYPFGGHAIFIEAKKFLAHIPKEEFPAQALAVELYLEGGIRTSEIGTLMADRDPVTRENRYPRLEFLRLAIPRRVYTNNHMNYVAAALKNIFDRRESLTRGLEIEWEAPIMRHFTVQLKHHTY